MNRQTPAMYEKKLVLRESIFKMLRRHFRESHMSINFCLFSLI